MRIEVAYATPERQLILEVELAENMTVGQAIQVSGILDCFPEIDLKSTAAGIFGRVCDPGQRLRPGDRVEIYRPLIADPISARRARIQKRQSN
jgi:putative ubiquitin-RnfH superfamily antitoxin RatB of RatAB toxin-antitoxin module